MGILYHPALGKSRAAVNAAAILVILGGLATMYVIIIGGQAFPMAMFPGKEVLESGFFDGAVASYSPSLSEVALGVGGIAATLLMTAIGIRMLRFLPETLADDRMDARQD